MKGKNINKRKENTISCLLKSAIMKCLCTGDQHRWIDEMATYGLTRTRRRGATPTTNEAEAYEYTIEDAEATLRDAANLNHEVCFFICTSTGIIFLSVQYILEIRQNQRK